MIMATNHNHHTIPRDDSSWNIRGLSPNKVGQREPKSKTADSTPFLNLALVWAAVLCRRLIPKFEPNEKIGQTIPCISVLVWFALLQAEDEARAR